ncbi:hypothetical protein [Nannocystis pusilla]|uniref:hypothetical protein n=1 Tax=Nannocystis pusilla TaxID=889268 RepID=UPI003DA5E392
MPAVGGEGEVADAVLQRLALTGERIDLAQGAVVVEDEQVAAVLGEADDVVAEVQRGRVGVAVMGVDDRGAAVDAGGLPGGPGGAIDAGEQGVAGLVRAAAGDVVAGQTFDRARDVEAGHVEAVEHDVAALAVDRVDKGALGGLEREGQDSAGGEGGEAFGRAAAAVDQPVAGVGVAGVVEAVEQAIAELLERVDARGPGLPAVRRGGQAHRFVQGAGRGEALRRDRVLAARRE